ncbi:Nin-like protein [Hymenobacter setariae]|uniref:Nin-like protein n=1 Tax=Hymenobacter setariae TaxID=2594794 RepID=A0A558C2Q0_9BACT|nr:Nin-like protein [Hymenobacter setariae]TVT43101.1 Nin-like protein [Hymenobacter setariae]
MSTARVIANSGGRTSGVMALREMAKGLGPADYIVFCNTGKEREETLRFLHLQETVLGVPIIWLEYCRFNKWKRVSYETASRKGEPFEALLTNRRNGKVYLPNFMTRYCTQELKIRVMRDFMRSQGHRHYVSLVGIRYDEPRRHANGKNDRSHDVEHPLYHARITKPDVLAIWKAQPFDLELKDHEGNCDLCFMKGEAKLLDIIRSDPNAAQWWIDGDAAGNGRGFRPTGRASYADLLERTQVQPMLDFWPEAQEESLTCFCTD